MSARKWSDVINGSERPRGREFSEAADALRLAFARAEEDADFNAFKVRRSAAALRAAHAGTKTATKLPK